MNFRKVIISFCFIILFGLSAMYANQAVKTMPSKKFDLSKWHNVGNIWLRVSNYGFFGSGSSADPQWPSLEFPGGSGVDYLYQGSLWFGAKKFRRNAAKEKLFWLADNPSADSSGVVAEFDTTNGWNNNLKAVIDTLVTVGFDGDKDLYEFLPAYNPLESGIASTQSLFDQYNVLDMIATASSRYQKRGVDDDGDGLIDEDFVGYTFPLREDSELPSAFQGLGWGGHYIKDTNNFGVVTNPNNFEIWFPLGFMNLATFTTVSDYLHSPFGDFSSRFDDDNDGQFDEDGAPVSEQDFISYYYDYSPFGTTGERAWGSSRTSNKHVPLKVMVRQMSYQWSYEYIKNLVYVEFDITNMNELDDLMDCAMGIYMDSDVGPQSYGPEKASDDLSGYVMGPGYEFAYTKDDDGDGGLTPGLVGSRVCTPDPELLRFSCWYWKVGDGPDDFAPQSLSLGSKKTANEKYWLLTGRNPNPGSSTKYQILRGGPSGDQAEFIQPAKSDTRYLFAFYGAQPGTTDYADVTKKWTLAPGKTMKIVIAIFPGDNLEDLKRSARWAKEIYGAAQTLTSVVQPDIAPHYNPPEPPEIPKLYAELVTDILPDGSVIDGNQVNLFWDNRSEFSYDVKTVSTAVIGWMDPTDASYIPGLDSDPTSLNPDYPFSDYPVEFRPNATNVNLNARINPYTGYRLRHDFQGYSVWGRSGSGSQENWGLMQKWDKIDTERDLADYNKNSGTNYYTNYGGYLGANKDLPINSTMTGNLTEKVKFYRYDDNYKLTPVEVDENFYGYPLYNPSVDWTPALQAIADAMVVDPTNLTDEEKLQQATLFKYPAVSDAIFMNLVDDKLIPLIGHGGQVAIPDTSTTDTSKLVELKKGRLARRYYTTTIPDMPKGIEYYVAVTAFDRGIPSNNLDYLETGRDVDANMKVFFPGPLAKRNMKNIYVVPNPYIGSSKFDGRRENDRKGDKSKRLWFVNLPDKCTIRIYTLAGDLVDTINHEGAYNEDIINISKAASLGLAASGIHAWDLLSKHNQIIASGVYLFSVENKANGDIKVGKFVIIK